MLKLGIYYVWPCVKNQVYTMLKIRDNYTRKKELQQGNTYDLPLNDNKETTNQKQKEKPKQEMYGKINVHW